MRLQGDVAIITGGASGLGKATCLRFAAEGAKVVVADYNFEAAEQVVAQIQSLGGSALALKVDVSRYDEYVAKMATTVMEVFGRIDILINNAGITKDAVLWKMTEEQWDRVIDINQKGVFNCTRAVFPHMRAQGYGRIINTSSIVKDGNFGQTNYAATKAALVAMTKTWAKEFGGFGITVNAVAPGFMLTPMTEAMKPEKLQEQADKVPVKRLGSPEDIANAYLFLSERSSSYINGAVLDVNGGLTV